MLKENKRGKPELPQIYATAGRTSPTRLNVPLQKACLPRKQSGRPRHPPDTIVAGASPEEGKSHPAPSVQSEKERSRKETPYSGSQNVFFLPAGGDQEEPV